MQSYIISAALICTVAPTDTKNRAVFAKVKLLHY